jgi:hypothetical protein
VKDRITDVETQQLASAMRIDVVAKHADYFQAFAEENPPRLAKVRRGPPNLPAVQQVRQKWGHYNS